VNSRCTPSVRPITKKNYAAEVASPISKGGMVAIASGSTGGGATGTSVCRLDSI
jgi:hypothetical protein